MRRRDLVGLTLLSAAGASRAQPQRSPSGKRRLAVLMLKRRDKDVEANEQELRSALAEFKWIADRNLTIEWHFANEDRSRLPALAAEIVRSGPDAILTYLVPPTRALQLATKTIPIVTGVGDPIGPGFARSYAQPGGNITGLSFAYVERQHKKIELLRSASPVSKRLIIAMKSSDASTVQDSTPAPMSAARAFGFVPELALIATVADLQDALRPDSAMVAYGFRAPSSPVKIGDLIAFSLAKKVPTVVDDSESVALGGLLSFELYWDNQARQMAAQIDKVLRGVSPAQIPIELPTRSWTAVNLKTARALGLLLPQTLVARADEVIQ